MKLECSCGARYSFDELPGQFVCPECGVDHSEALKQLAGSAGATASAPMAAPVVEDNPSSEAPAVCLRHGNQVAVERCRVCGKPICPDCMDLFGYVCSAYCRQQAQDHGITLPVYQWQREQLAAETRHHSRRTWLIAGGAGVLVVLVLGWFWLVARRPHVAYSVPFASTGLKGRARLLAPGEALLIRDGTLTRYQSKGQLAWSVPWTGQPSAGSLAEGRMLWVCDGRVVWLGGHGRLGRVSVANGRLEEAFESPGQILGLAGNTQAVMAEVMTPLGERLLWRLPKDQRIELDPGNRQGELLVGARSVVQWSTEFLRALEAPRVAESESHGLDGTVTAGNSMALAGELLRDIQRQGAEESQASIPVYRLTVTWPLEKGAKWEGEVTGEPHLAALESVTALTAYTNLLVFDHSGSLLWRRSLAYPVRELDPDMQRQILDGREWGHCFADGGTLYVWDTGMLSAFDLASGEAQWRLPQGAIVGVEVDSKGMVYANAFDVLDSSTGLSRVVRPLILKVDPGSGQVIWRARHVGHIAKATGSFLYSVEWAPGQDNAPLRPGRVPAHIRIYRLSPADGTVLWDYYDRREPVQIDCYENTVLLLFKDQMEVLKFFAF